MTITQAHQAMQEGKVIYHIDATSCYQMYLGSNVIDGVGNDKNAEFESLKTNPVFADAWQLEAFEDDFLNDLK